MELNNKHRKRGKFYPNFQHDFQQNPSNINPKDKIDFMSFVDIASKEVVNRKYTFFNADGLRNDKKALEYDKIFEKDTIVFCMDTRLTNKKQLILNELAKKHDKLIYAQQNQQSNMIAGSLISLPQQYFLENPEVVNDNYYRYTLIAFKDDKARKTLLGAIYMKPALMKPGLEAINKQFCEIELAIESKRLEC